MSCKFSFVLPFVFPLIAFVQAHTWVEELSVVDDAGGMIGAPGSPRGFGS